MLRWMTPFLVAIFAIGTAAAAEPRSRQARRCPRSSKACRQPCRRQARRQPGNCQASDSSGRRQTRQQPGRSEARREPRRRQARRGSRRQPIAARPAPRPLQLPDHGCPRRRAALCAPRPHVGGRGRGSRRAVHAGRHRCPMRRASSARRCCRAHRRCPAITEPAIPTAMTAPITAAPMAVLEPPALRLRRVRILLNAH